VIGRNDRVLQLLIQFYSVTVPVFALIYIYMTYDYKYVKRKNTYSSLTFA
jgi:hypothetical protein